MLMNFVRQQRWMTLFFAMLFCLFQFCILFQAASDCEDYKDDIDYWRNRVKELKTELAKVEAKNPLTEAVKGAGIGAGIGLVGGAAIGAFLGPVGAGAGAVKGVIGGGIGGALTALLAYRSELNAAKKKVEDAEKSLQKAKDEYEKNQHDDSPLSISYNQTTFEVYETLAVGVTKDDLYMVTMEIDGEFVTAYPGSDGAAVLEKSFDSGDAGQNFTVTVTVWYGDVNSPKSSTHTSTVYVE